MGFVTERSKGSQNRQTELRTPLVAYTVADGEPRQVKGLGGGLSNLEIGAPVEVRYRPDNPAHAVVGNFQNIWGVVWGMGVFGLMPTLFGPFFVGGARADRAGQRVLPRQRDPTSAQVRRRRYITMGSNALFLGGFAVAVFYPFDDFARSLGLGLMIVGFGAWILA